MISVKPKIPINRCERSELPRWKSITWWEFVFAHAKTIRGASPRKIYYPPGIRILLRKILTFLRHSEMLGGNLFSLAQKQSVGRRFEKSQINLRFLLGSYHERTLRVRFPARVGRIKIRLLRSLLLILVISAGIEPALPG